MVDSPSEYMEFTKYLSKLKITNPQIIPITNAAIPGTQDFSSFIPIEATVYAAYPIERVANIAVPNIVPPIPAFFAQSVGHMRRRLLSRPPQVQRNS